MISAQPKISLAGYTTFGVGGVAEWLVEVGNENELLQAVEFAKHNNLRILALGGGSNVLVSDAGFSGLVIVNRIKSLASTDNGEVFVGAGEAWDEVVMRTVEKNLAGIECLSGVPGFAGGAVVQNIGCYGQTLGDRVEKVRAYNIRSRRFEEFSRQECRFVYRGSIFKNNSDYIVTSFELKLIPKGLPALTYQDVLQFFQGKPRPSLAELREAVLEIRAGKGMIINPNYVSFKSVGSYFKNPVVSQKDLDRIRSVYSEEEGRPWYWNLPDGTVKVSAAKLISLAGFAKGFVENPRVGISPKQPLAIINLGGATAADITDFAAKIKKGVQQKFGVELEEEVVYIGQF